MSIQFNFINTNIHTERQSSLSELIVNNRLGPVRIPRLRLSDQQSELQLQWTYLQYCLWAIVLLICITFVVLIILTSIHFGS